MLRRSRVGAAVALCFATALSSGIAAAPAQAVPNVCGGALTDYVGLVALDTAFSGTVKAGNEELALTITPVFATANVLRVEIGTGNYGRVKSANFTLNVNSSGRGEITFSGPDGGGASTEVNCSAGLTPTRVTKINGKMTVDGHGASSFVVTRA